MSQSSADLTQVQRYEAGQTLPTLEVMKKLSIGLSVSADLLLFDEEERGPDDRLLMQFEAVKQFDEEDRQLALGLLEGLILKHQAKRLLLRSGSRLDTGQGSHRATATPPKLKRPARAER
jgi:transcriptional regulator with XRE-family HTH domain